jgi:guanylate kinase
MASARDNSLPPVADAVTPGRLLVISGPSGSGKSTIVRELVASGEFPIRFSVSATTRPKRPGEIEGRHYRFLGRTEFEKLRAADELLEWAEVHGNLYGTPRKPVQETLAQGGWVLLEIDCEGHRQVKRLMPDSVSVFIRAPSDDLYEARLRLRSTESEAELGRRLDDVKHQLGHAASYDFQVVNETVEQAVRTLRTLLRGVEARQTR